MNSDRRGRTIGDHQQICRFQGTAPRGYQLDLDRPVGEGRSLDGLDLAGQPSLQEAIAAKGCPAWSKGNRRPLDLQERRGRGGHAPSNMPPRQLVKSSASRSMMCKARWGIIRDRHPDRRNISAVNQVGLAVYNLPVTPSAQEATHSPQPSQVRVDFNNFSFNIHRLSYG